MHIASILDDLHECEMSEEEQEPCRHRWAFMLDSRRGKSDESDELEHVCGVMNFEIGPF